MEYDFETTPLLSGINRLRTYPNSRLPEYPVQIFLDLSFLYLFGQ